mgnify:CR=1 FL=1|jgi:hypothetical protein
MVCLGVSLGVSPVGCPMMFEGPKFIVSDLVFSALNLFLFISKRFSSLVVTLLRVGYMNLGSNHNGYFYSIDSKIFDGR